MIFAQWIALMDNNPKVFMNNSTWQEALPILREVKTALEESAYESTEILPHPGKLPDLPLEIANLTHFFGKGHNLFHQSWLPSLYRALLRQKNPRAVEFHQIFQLCRPFSRKQLETLLPYKLVACLFELEAFETVAQGFRSRVMITPFRGKVYLSDPVWLKGHNDFVYMGRTSFTIPEVLLDTLESDHPAKPRGRLLDLGCGAGILGMAVASHYEEVVGTDVVDRCLRYAELNAALNLAENCRFHYSDVYSKVEGTFDVIVTNPPCGWVDPDEVHPNFLTTTFANGGRDWGSELPARILLGAIERLNPDGIIYAALECPIIGGKPYVIDVMKRIYRCTGVDIVVYPVLEEYWYRHSRTYHRAGISAMVRYMTIIKPAGTLTIRFDQLDSIRLMGYKAKAAIYRFAAALTGGPRHSIE